MSSRAEAARRAAPTYSRRVKAGVVAADLLVVAVAALLTAQSLEAHRAAARTHAQNLARLLDGTLTATLDRIDLALQAVGDEHAHVSATGAVDGPALEGFMERHRARIPALLSIRVAGPDGVIRHHTPPVAAPVSIADRDYFVALRDDPSAGLFVGHPYVGRVIQVPVLVVARRLSTGAGAFAGVVLGAIPLSHLSDLVAEMDVGARGTISVRRIDLPLLARKGPSRDAPPFGDTRVPPEVQALLASGRSGATADARSPIDGIERTYAVRALDRYPLVVQVGLAPDDYLASWKRGGLAVWGLVAALLALTIAVAWWGTPAWQRAEVERLLAERTEHLRESEERFRIAFQTSPDSINLTRMDGRYVAVNEGFLRVTGFTEEEVLGRTSLELGIWVDPADRDRLVDAMRRDGYLENLEARFRGKDGRIIQGLMSARRIVLRGEPLLLTITRDVGAWKAAEAERDRLQLQVLQAQRLEGIGRLAGGVAHDFNNLLTVILGCIESLRERVEGEAREDVEQISVAAGRARDLTRQLLAFARRQVIAPVPLDLGSVVRDGERLLRRVVGEDVALTVEIEDGLWPVLCDPAQLEQVLLNLVVNAREAMPAGGTLSITARNAEGPLPADPQTGAARAGPWVRLSVRDTGTGMTPDVQAHLFEPFFTTKAGAQGTGLGLATVHGIVAQSGGHIEVETAPGRGTRFDVYLPRAAGAAVPVRPAPAPARAEPGGETVLVVEDDPLVRSVTVRALRAAGHAVLVAGSGAEAIALAARHAGPVDLVVSDVVMPGLSGPQMVAELRIARPALRALFVSGYSQEVVAERGVLGGVELLPKPFTSAALLERVRALLAPARTGPGPGPGTPGAAAGA